MRRLGRLSDPAAGLGTKKKVAMTIQGLPTLNADATCNLGSKSPKAEISATGESFKATTRAATGMPLR
jgi:hypothetical protein